MTDRLRLSVDEQDALLERISHDLRDAILAFDPEHGDHLADKLRGALTLIAAQGETDDALSEPRAVMSSPGVSVRTMAAAGLSFEIEKPDEFDPRITVLVGLPTAGTPGPVSIIHRETVRQFIADPLLGGTHEYRLRELMSADHFQLDAPDVERGYFDSIEECGMQVLVLCGDHPRGVPANAGLAAVDWVQVRAERGGS